MYSDAGKALFGRVHSKGLMIFVKSYVHRPDVPGIIQRLGGGLQKRVDNRRLGPGLVPGINLFIFRWYIRKWRSSEPPVSA